jgi:hypothetical protein
MPRERAFAVAERLSAQGLKGADLRLALVELGFANDEATVAMNALPRREEVVRSTVDHSELQRQGYFSFLFAAPLISGGLLLGLLLPGAFFLAASSVAVGVWLMARGLWLFWHGRDA